MGSLGSSLSVRDTVCEEGSDGCGCSPQFPTVLFYLVIFCLEIVLDYEGLVQY